MIFVTGDTHNNNNIQKLYTFAADNPQLTKSDYVIIAGDFSAVWDGVTLEANLNLYSALPFTVLFVDGNHENFDMLNAYPVSQWQGGKVHIIRPDIIHLMRGQVYLIDGRTFFTFGGGTTLDKYRRRPGISLWKQEIPSAEEISEGVANLKRYSNKVDFIITHSCDEKALWYPPLRDGPYPMHAYADNQILSYFEDIATYGHWYFGHYHIDANITPTKTAVFNSVIRLV